ncbi:ABC-2 family transporter [Natranaerovirga hydrolytica]|uniref:ABC-2 family transporter n=1 Tax=Natranaerovirga hydrolytica TaxID=680378 RepID=A0A4V2Q1M3_9FIRM|nr:ABC transporter permease [Natranaerovirga hydrolytica]TCK98161.1 ABC-2 family transporter [Natranaerovirga hydrolytica]
MSKFLTLLKCEEKRMLKYGITYASLAASFIWIIMIQIINVDTIDPYFPLFIFLDATMMSFLLIGVGMMFEKQEHALKSIMVLPMSKHYYLLSKIFATVLSSVLTLVILLAYGVSFRGLDINYIGITSGVILVAFVFACLGILCTYQSKDFTHLLMWVFIGTFLLAIPTVLQFFNVITATWFEYVQHFNPTKAALVVLMNTVTTQETNEFIISLSYLIGLSVVLYYFVSKKFDSYSVKEYGGE